MFRLILEVEILSNFRAKLFLDGNRSFSEEFPEKFCNQFPNECILTCKDLFTLVCRRAVPVMERHSTVNPSTLQSSPLWLPTTYNLESDLPNFVAYYRAREVRGLDNYWICKPWNLVRIFSRKYH